MKNPITTEERVFTTIINSPLVFVYEVFKIADPPRNEQASLQQMRFSVQLWGFNGGVELKMA